MKDDKLGDWIKKAVLGDHHPKANSERSAEKLTPFSAGHGDPPPQRSSVGSDRPFKRRGRRKGRYSTPASGGNRPYGKESVRDVSNPIKTAAPPSSPRAFSKPFHGSGSLRVIPLGGLEEVGKNMMVIEYRNPGSKEATDIIIIDVGFQFPEEDMLGIDYVIPDTSYLEGKTGKIRGVLLTHGHLDHIGGIPYLYEKLGEPEFFGTPLTLGLVSKKLEEFKLARNARLNNISYNEHIKLGHFEVEFFRVNHSFPDSAGIIVRSPAGIIVHTGDFKFDFTPADKKPADFAKIASLSSENVVALFSDSTNAMKPGYTMSEKLVGEALHGAIKDIQGRIIIATFSSSIGRIQQIIDAAVLLGRKVYLSGRSIVDNVGIAVSLHYINAPKGTVTDIKKASKRDIEAPNSIIITTGSQGEALSALARMSMNDHAQISLKKGDTVLFSSSPIIGNERAIYSVINNLCKMGVSTISNSMMDIHTSGHGYQEDLKLMMNLVQPKYVVPIHGQLYMRTAHVKLAESIGFSPEHVITANNGSIIEIHGGEAKLLKDSLETNYIMVDGLGVGSLGSQILMEREVMAGNGVLIIVFHAHNNKLTAPPDILSRGFIYLKESQELIENIAKEAVKTYQEILKKDSKVKRGDIKAYIRGRLDRYIHSKIAKTPLIIPIIVEK